jgi:phage terminase large subunit GpA-like protein
MLDVDLTEFDLADGAAAYAGAYARGSRPPAPLPVSTWADAHRVLTSKSSAEHGPWRTDRTPYLREIMDCLSSESRVREVVLMKATQVGGSEVGLNWLGYVIERDPGPFLALLPTLKLARRWSKQRVEPMIDACPALRALVPPARKRDSGNTTLEKEFRGGLLVMVGANSTSDFRSMPAKYVLMEEVDEYGEEVGEQGQPRELVRKRQTTFTRRKSLEISSPTIEGASAIEESYLEGDQRTYRVPCPHCAVAQELVIEQLTDDGNYLCTACGRLIEEHHKPAMLAGGAWIAKHPQRAKRSYHLSGLYSPIGLGMSWVEIAAERRKARTNAEVDLTFTNTVLGLPHRGVGQRVDPNELRERREGWVRRTVPRGALILTLAIDVQHNRWEVLVCGWGRGEQCWFVDWVAIAGDPTREEDWADLDAYVFQPFVNACGMTMRPEVIAIDAGNWSHDVYRWARRHAGSGVIAVKGAKDATAPVIGRPSAKDINAKGRTIRNGVQLWNLGVNSAKTKLFGLLAGDAGTESADERRCHAPKDMPDDFFEQLTAEIFDTRNRRWVKKRAARNEALDCWVYAYAAACHPRVRLHLMREHQWAELERKLEPEVGDLFGVAALPPPASAPPASEKSSASRETSRTGNVGLGREGWNFGSRG